MACGLLQSAAQALVSDCRVRKAQNLGLVIRALERYGEIVSAHINPNQERLPHVRLPLYPSSRFPDPVPAPIGLVDAGSRASDTPRPRRRGRGTHLTYKLVASDGFGLPWKKAED